MTCIGTVNENGVVVLPTDSGFPAGTKVRVTSVPEEDNRPIGQKLLELAGTVKGPPDLAANHDHYLHGAPKRKP
jgi:hypothetical protein